MNWFIIYILTNLISVLFISFRKRIIEGDTKEVPAELTKMPTFSAIVSTLVIMFFGIFIIAFNKKKTE